MCGISVIISPKKEKPNKREIIDMNSRVSHRGPDFTSYRLINNCAFGHTRLSILDLNDSANQPFEDDNYIITYNGEIFNYIELRQQLIKYGYNFKTNSDTEVIIKLYDKFGLRSFNMMNGMWALSIYDKIKEEVVVSRDRFGIKPLYYSFKNNKIYFFSEIKQFQIDKKLSLNKKVLIDYLFSGRILDKSETIYEGLYKFPASHNFVIRENKIIHKSKYYDFERNFNNNSLKKNIDELDFLIHDSVKLRLRSDVKIGSLLSGGVDSSLLTSVAKSFKPNIESFHFKSEKYDESSYAKFISDKYKIKLNFINEKINLKYFEDLIEGFDYPFNSLSIYAQNQVFSEAKKNKFKVLLSGQGADELFLGYDRYKYLESRMNYKYYIFYNKFINNLFNKFRFKMSSELYKIFKNRDNINHRKNKDFFDFQKDEIERFQLPQLLFYEDQNSMLNSIESRVPFLDYRLVEFATNLPFNQKIRHGETKYILKELIRLRGDGRILDRDEKFGFEFDFNVFFSSRPKSDLINKIKLNPIFSEFINFFSIDNIKNNDWLFWRFVCMYYLINKYET